jgi:hypothetical protein
MNAILTQYTIVCQAPKAKPYTICAYSGTDLSPVLGITQAKTMHEGYYGWIQVCGVVKVKGRTQAAYADFRPNEAKLNLNNKKLEELGTKEKYERLSKLPPILIENGPYCGLLREARDVFVDGHFYACVAMCGISFERFQRDRAKVYGATKKDKMWQVREILKNNNALSPETLNFCENMANLRNEYAHGTGLKPKEDSLKSLGWMHSFIEKETDLMRDYIIIDGMLHRKHI